MSEPKEVSVRIKADERNLKHKFLIYDDINVSSEDPILQGCVKEALEDFKGTPESVTINIKFEYQP